MVIPTYRRFGRVRRPFGAYLPSIFFAAMLLLSPISSQIIYDAGAAEPAPPQLVPDPPDRYVVQEGDTLWGIAQKFLIEPWQWPEIWQQNPDIENPHLIFPGDVLLLSTASGTSGGAPEVRVLRNRKLSKLSPAMRTEPIEAAVPTISPDMILPFLRKPLIIERGELDGAPYVAVGEEGDISLGKYSVFFGRGFNRKYPAKAGDLYNIFRPGKLLIHPQTNEALGIQAMHLGVARVLEVGETAKLEIILAHEDINPGDRMTPFAENISLPYFYPRAPERKVAGIIVDAPQAVAELSRLQPIVITLGQRDEIEPGHVLRILRKEQLRKDPVTGKLFEPPLQSSGLAMVFKSFEKVSYALVMTSNRVIHIRDLVATP